MFSANSPLSANIYFPVIPTISRDLGVTVEQVNISVTVYMILQGVSPSFFGAICDVLGRRPVYISTFIMCVFSHVKSSRLSVADPRLGCPLKLPRSLRRSRQHARVLAAAPPSLHTSRRVCLRHSHRLGLDRRHCAAKGPRHVHGRFRLGANGWSLHRSGSRCVATPPPRMREAGLTTRSAGGLLADRFGWQYAQLGCLRRIGGLTDELHTSQVPLLVLVCLRGRRPRPARPRTA